MTTPWKDNSELIYENFKLEFGDIGTYVIDSECIHKEADKLYEKYKQTIGGDLNE